MRAGPFYQFNRLRCAEPFGCDAQHVPSHALGGVVLLHVGLEAFATDVAAIGVDAAFHLDGHLGGGDGIVEAPLARWVEQELTHALVAGCLFDDAGEVSLDFSHCFHFECWYTIKQLVHRSDPAAVCFSLPAQQGHVNISMSVFILFWKSALSFFQYTHASSYVSNCLRWRLRPIE